MRRERGKCPRKNRGFPIAKRLCKSAPPQIVFTNFPSLAAIFARMAASRRNRKAARTVRTAFFEYIFRIPLQSGMPTRTAARTPRTRRRASARHKCRLRKKPPARIGAGGFFRLQPGLQPQPAFTGRGCCRQGVSLRSRAREKMLPGKKCRKRWPP